jgi:hypothetical protein
MVLVVLEGSVPEFRVSVVQSRERGINLTEQLEVVLAMLKLIEADICFDCDTRSGIPNIRVTAGHDGETLAFGFPRKIGDSVWIRP